MTQILTAYEDKLTTVPRWGIVRTVNKQSVADHCFLVALMAPRIAIAYFNWNPERDCQSLYELTRYALLHDQHEAYTGDIPSPMKNVTGFDKVSIEEAYAPWINETPTITNVAIKTIVKLADYLESIRFLDTEVDMGNASVILLRDHIVAKFMTFCDTNGVTVAEYTAMLAEIGWHYQDPLDHPPTPKVDDDCPF